MNTIHDFPLSLMPLQDPDQARGLAAKVRAVWMSHDRPPLALEAHPSTWMDRASYPRYSRRRLVD